MTLTREKVKSFLHLALINLWNYGKILLLIVIFAKFFGFDNTLPAVCIAVGWLMFPNSKLDIKPSVMTFNIFFLFLLGTIAAQLVHVNVFGAAVGYFITTVILLAFSISPFLYQPYIPFFLNFIFCQSVPVNAHGFMLRLLAVIIGSAFVSAMTYYTWRKKGLDKTGRNLKQLLTAAWRYKEYILKMACGLTLAMGIAQYFSFAEPLWVSVVVLSLTQMDRNKMFRRTKDRVIGTVIGILIFTIVIQILIPHRYAMLFILVMGYVSFFFTQYRTKTIINAISALNASLVFLPGKAAVADRLGGLVLGIIIVFGIELIAYVISLIISKSKPPQPPQRPGPEEEGEEDYESLQSAAQSAAQTAAGSATAGPPSMGFSALRLLMPANAK